MFQPASVLRRNILGYTSLDKLPGEKLVFLINLCSYLQARICEGECAISIFDNILGFGQFLDSPAHRRLCNPQMYGYINTANATVLLMERHGIEWEHKRTHEKHLSVLDYKKQERAAELEQLGAKIEEKQIEFNVLSERVLHYDDGLENLKNVEEMLDSAPEYQLSEPQGFMSAKAYKTKIVEPLIQKLKALVKTALARCFEGWDNYHRLNITNGNLYRENEMLSKINSKLKSENENLHSEVKDYKLLRKVFGHKQIDELLEQARNIKGRKRENPRSR